jgi:hypothetical protein
LIDWKGEVKVVQFGDLQEFRIVRSRGQAFALIHTSKRHTSEGLNFNIFASVDNSDLILRGLPYLCCRESGRRWNIWK